MRRIAFHVLLSLALVCAGGVAQLHALTHAQQDVAHSGGAHEAGAHVDLASKGAGCGDEAPTLDHATDQCLVIHALDAVGSSDAAGVGAASVSTQVVLPVSSPRRESSAAAFLSRAPPQPA